MLAVFLALAIQLVSVADEIAIGKQAQAEIRRQTPEVTDPAVAAYVRRIGSQLAAHAGAPAPRPSQTKPELAVFDVLIARAMAKEPDERPASAGALAADAHAALRGIPSA